MPRRKNKKHRKRRIQQTLNIPSENAASNSEKMRTCIETSAKESPCLSLTFPEPIKTPSPQTNLEITGSPIRTTPVNRCNKERKKSYYGSMNVTNLNMLFETHSETDISKIQTSVIKRSRSSIPKLHSPGKERPLKVHQSIQVGIDSPPVHSINDTPKSSNVFVFQGPCYLNNQIPSEVNVNPYLKNKELQVLNKDSSLSAFFSPKLFQHKLSSTPIEKIQDICLEESVDYNFKISKLNLSNNLIYTTGTPKFNVSLNAHCNFNNSLTEKVTNKENSIKNFKTHTCNVSKRNSYRISPNKSKNSSRNDIKKSRRFSYSKNGNTSQKNDRSISQIGATEKVFRRLKNYCSISQGWSSKVIDVCTQLGAQLKNSLASLCNLYNDSLDEHSVSNCKCEEYKQHINELREEIENLRTEVKDQQNSREIVEQLSSELRKVKEEVEQLKTVCSEFQTLKQQLEFLQTSKLSCKNPQLCSTGSLQIPTPPSLSFVPPPAPPPPPPPPPPPLPTITSMKTPLTSSNSLTSFKRSKSIVEKENARPFISLDDILKVKLKKTSERTPVTRRTLQPMVSIEMLKQVKLRPASRSAVRTRTPEKSEDITSPHTNLCRLLKHESSSFRLKRLRKNCLSYDSVYRRNSISKRDREYDT